MEETDRPMSPLTKVVYLVRGRERIGWCRLE